MIDLTAEDPDAEQQYFQMSGDVGSMVNMIACVAFYEHEQALNADEALMAAAMCRTALDNGEVDKEYREDVARGSRNRHTLEEMREIISEYAEFAEQSGGYTVWA